MCNILEPFIYFLLLFLLFYQNIHEHCTIIDIEFIQVLNCSVSDFFCITLIIMLPVSCLTILIFFYLCYVILECYDIVYLLLLF